MFLLECTRWSIFTNHLTDYTQYLLLPSSHPPFLKKKRKGRRGEGLKEDSDYTQIMFFMSGQH
jgi:hypothetical protein